MLPRAVSYYFHGESAALCIVLSRCCHGSCAGEGLPRIIEGLVARGGETRPGKINLKIDLIMRRVGLALFFAPFVAGAFASHAEAQDNYEIQVYGSETVTPRSTMFEIHSNFTVEGSKTVQDGMLPTNHAEHETLEITQGISDWAEVGFYVFTSIQPNEGWQWVGDHIRPRVRAPERWHWPVGVSLSNEIGYQRAAFSPDTWTW